MSAPPTRFQAPPALGRGAGLLFLAAAACWMALVGAYQVDDAWIVYRYAENLAAGEGFVFNPGDRVEGVSTLSWTLALVPFAAAGLSLPAIAPWLSAACGLVVLVLAPRVSARMGGRPAPDFVDQSIAPLLLFQPAFAFWSRGALETLPFALVLLLALNAHLRERSEQRVGASAGWLALAVFTRPETPLYTLAFAADRVWSSGDRREGARQALRLCAWVGAALALLVVFRLAYFGEWLPNTYYAKTGAPLGRTLGAGTVYSLGFFFSLLPHPPGTWPLVSLVPAAGVLALAVWGARRAAQRPAALLLLLSFAAVVWNGGDWMPLHRFWVPGLPLILLLAVACAREKLAGPRASRLGVALALGLIAFGAATSLAERLDPAGRLHPVRPNTEVYARLASLLRERAQSGQAAALMDIGQVGYQSRLPLIDISGLVTPWIARSPGGFLDKRYPVAQLLEEQPEFFVLRPRYFRIDARIANDRLFQARYRELERMALFEPGRPDSELIVFERRR